MADTNDPYGYDVWRPAPITGARKGADGISTGLSVVAPEYATVAPGVTTPVATLENTPVSEGFARSMRSGSPLNTLYGVDDESYLTEDQRKTMRQIQGKFDASLNRRDRELARYGAPQLSSFVEDEALARAIAGAQALNYPEYVQPAAPVAGASGGSGRDSPSRGYYTRTPQEPENEQTGAQTNAQWQRILSGLASIAPLLFGKDAWGGFMNKGLISTVKEAIFGKDVAAYMPDASFEAIVRSGVLPTAGGGEYILNPITGMPMIPDPNMINVDAGYGSGSYGPEPEWGYAPPTEADWGYGLNENPGWEGGDWGLPDMGNWWDFSGGSGGDYVDLFGGV